MRAHKTPRRNVDLEQRKLEIEEQKLKVERIKAWTGNASIVLSLLIAGATISVGIWSQYQQSKLQLALQEEQTKNQSIIQKQQAESQFELKAAEIVMNSNRPIETLNKAKALQNLFPKHLPDHFAASFDPTTYTNKNQAVNIITWAGHVDASGYVERKAVLSQP